MFIYLATFFLSYVLLRAGHNGRHTGKYNGKHNGKHNGREGGLEKVYVTAALLLPSILAGCRDYSIGTDVSGYGNTWFRYAVNIQSFGDYVAWAVASGLDSIYAVINYAVALFTSNAHWFYFWLSMLTNCLIYKAAKDNEDLVDVPFSMLTYYLLFYNRSLNALRQSLAMAFVACAFTYIRKRQIVPFLIFALLAINTHASAVVVFSLYLIYISINGQYGNLAKVILLAGITTATVAFSPVARMLIQMGIISSRYRTYLDTLFRGGGIVRLFLLCLPYLILLVFFTRDNGFKKERRALGCYLTISTVLSFLAFRMAYAVRIAYYFDIYLIFSIPYIAGNSKYAVIEKNKNRNKMFLTCFMLVYWVYVYVIRQGDETVPYKFMS